MSKMSQVRRGEQSGKTWQQQKSENTRSAILDAAIDCFYDLGYGGTTTAKVALRAGVSRGAMLHHFPTRIELVRAAVGHLNRRRIALFEAEEVRIQAGAEHSRIDEGIDSFWQQLASPLFVVFHELQVAARTDAELRDVLVPAIREFDAAWLEMVERIFPDLSQSEHFDLANLLTLFLLEGMAVNGFTRTTGGWTNMVLDELKRRLNELFSDVLTTVDRRTATPRRGRKESAL